MTLRKSLRRTLFGPDRPPLTIVVHPRKSAYPTFVVLVSIVLTGVLLTAGYLGLWCWWTAVSAVPSPPLSDARVLILTDAPNRALQLEAYVRGLDFANESEVQISVSAPQALVPVEYWLLFEGEAFDNYEYESPDRHLDGCSIQVQVVRTDSVTCATENVEVALGAAYSGVYQVLHATLLPGAYHTLYVSTGDHSWSEVGGKRTVFQLPEIGTIYIPPNARSVSFVQLEDGTPLWIPGKLENYIEYRPLDVLEQVETVGPPLALGDQLAWLDTSESTLAPHGSLVNVTLAEQSVNQTFVIGVLAGVLPGALWALRGLGLWCYSRRMKDPPVVAAFEP